MCMSMAELIVRVIPEPALTEGLVPKHCPMSVTLVVAPTSPFAGKMLVIWGPGGGGQPPVSQPQPVGGGGKRQMTQQLLLTYSGARTKRFDGVWNSPRARYKGFPSHLKCN